MPQHCWIDLQHFDARLTARGRHSCWAQVNWHLISSLSGSVPEPNSAYQAQSLMWGEWCKVKWGLCEAWGWTQKHRAVVGSILAQSQMDEVGVVVCREMTLTDRPGLPIHVHTHLFITIMAVFFLHSAFIVHLPVFFQCYIFKITYNQRSIKKIKCIY